MHFILKFQFNNTLSYNSKVKQEEELNWVIVLFNSAKCEV